MGMTIDKSIAELEVLKKNTFSYMPAHQAFITAIDTMRKYQKIEQIVNSNPDYIHHTDMDTYKLNSIREVIEDDTRENQCTKGEY